MMQNPKYGIDLLSIIIHLASKKIMSTYSQLNYHIVFCTFKRRPVMAKENRELLYTYMRSIILNKKAIPLKINGIEDHLHILVSGGPNLFIPDLVKEIKLGSNSFIQSESLFENFEGWQEGYGVFSFAHRDRSNLINYVEKQEEHHRKTSSKEEYKELIEKHGILIDERFFA